MVAILVAAGVANARPPAAAPMRALSSADIDRQLATEWRRRGVHPGPLVDDAAFLRRVTIDLTGSLPTADAVREFLADTRHDKRARAVDVLLGSPAYAQHWAAYWDRLLMGRTARANPVLDRAAFTEWLRAELAVNRPWNEVAYALVTAAGENREHPATNWILRYSGNPTDLTGKLSRVFLGVQIQCAQCHDHPSEKWKQDDFRALTACFARTGPVPLEDKVKGQPRRVELRDQPGPTFGGGKMADLRLIALTPPRAPDGSDLSHADNRRVALAEWMTRPANPYFARAVVNRYWAHLVGRGFVEPVDDFRRSNPPVMPALLDALAGDFTAHHDDLQHLVRLIVNTRAYQLAVTGGVDGDLDEQLFVHHRMRALSAGELYNAVASATNLPRALERAGVGNVRELEQQIQGAFDFLFNVDEEAPPPADFAGSIQQALLFLNGRLINRASAAVPGMTLAGILDFPADDDARIEALYLRTLSRRPTPAERARWVAYVNAPRDVVVEPSRRARLMPDSKSAKKNPLGALERAARRLDPAEPTARQQAYEDLFWALLNSSEFTFQH